MPDPARHDTLDKRQSILYAARELFAVHGYDDTTIAQIAQAASVAVGTVYLYFANKHDILIDVCLALNAEIARVIQSPAILALPVRQVPRAIIEESFRSSRKNMRFMVYYQVEAQSPDETLRLRMAKQEIADALDVYFQWLIAQGQLPPFPTATYAELLNDLVSATLQQCFAFEHGEREDFYREGVIELIERLFFGPPLTAEGSERPVAQANGQ
ncbi:MAG TPA: TetR/AcrR family transcriptional regulator [Ktedonobacterales bacterium]|nr:TetR/AcrR family transcriptional regulator [Ktedonobacterales bacterium]